jgi:Na+/proline symporter
LDFAIIALYFVVVIGAGFWFFRRAAQNLDAYFLGNNRLSWLALSMSGAVSTFDITGTMWIVSMLMLLGMRSLWIHWMWGWMMGAFFMAYMGKWVRRSDVMTGAEWMRTRFGSGTAGQVARMASAIMAVLIMAGLIGYAFQGIGKFAHVYVPDFSRTTLAFGIIGITTFYVLVGGLYSVVVTDVIQTVVVTIGALVIMGVAYLDLGTTDIASALPAGWMDLTPTWRIEGGGVYELFGVLVLVWVAKGLLVNAGGPGQTYDFQRFLAAKDPRDAALIGAAWSGFLIVRWGMCMGIALLALTHLGAPTDTEETMPWVLNTFLPSGLKGLVMAGLLAAFMSTFSSTVNAGAAYLVRDLYQPYFAPGASDRHLVSVSYIATILLVACGIAIGMQAESITEIWEWLMTGLTAAIVVPNVLRWYWWRINGWGYAAGTLVGTVCAFVPFFSDTPWPMYYTFPLVVSGSFIGTVLFTFATEPVAPETLRVFYTRVRPFGLWGPVRRAAQLPPEAGESAWRTVLNVVLGMTAVHGAYLAPMFLVGHWHLRSLGCVALTASACTALYFTWYRHLPVPEHRKPNAG